MIKDPQSFIHPVPHMSFVRGSENVAFLKMRFEALSPTIFSIPCVVRKDSLSTFSIGYKICIAMEIYGV